MSGRIGSLNAAEMRCYLKADLERIPKALRGGPQIAFRAVYQLVPEHHLSTDPSLPPGASLSEARRLIRGSWPDFEPGVEQAYFEV